MLLLRSYRRFAFRDLSIPDIRSIEDISDRELRAHIRKRIEEADVVLVLARPAAGNSDWIRFELDVAVESNKRIVGVVPRGLTYVWPPVRKHASRIAQWDGDDIVRSIRKGKNGPSRILNESKPNKALRGRVENTASVQIDQFAVSAAEPPGPSPKEQIIATQERSRLRMLLGWLFSRRRKSGANISTG